MEQAPSAAAPMATSTKPKEEVITAFLNNGISMMQREDTRLMLKGVPDPGKKLIELQRAEWDPLGVDRDLGCQHLDQIEKLFPGNGTLVALRNEFIATAQRSYLRAMEDRKPDKLERVKPIPREVIVEFFDACNVKMDLPETRQQLLKHLETTKEIPNEIIINTQRDMLEVFGFEREHGCAMLSRIAMDFPNDTDLHQRFEVWRRKAQMTCMSVVRQHQMSGGEMPQQPFGMGGPPELMAKAKEEVEAMTMEQRKAHVEQFHKKVEVYMNLPPEAKASYMQKLPEPERLAFAKAQVMMVMAMQEQWQQQQQQQQHQHHHAHDGTGATGAPAAVRPGSCESKPHQQQMM